MLTGQRHPKTTAPALTVDAGLVCRCGRSWQGNAGILAKHYELEQNHQLLWLALLTADEALKTALKRCWQGMLAATGKQEHPGPRPGSCCAPKRGMSQQQQQQHEAIVMLALSLQMGAWRRRWAAAGRGCWQPWPSRTSRGILWRPRCAKRAHWCRTCCAV